MPIWESKVPWRPQQSNPQFQSCTNYHFNMLISFVFFDISCVYLALNWRIVNGVRFGKGLSTEGHPSVDDGVAGKAVVTIR